MQPNTILLFSLCTLVGITTGLLGIGGILLLPLLVILGFTLQQSIASLLLLNIIPTTIIGVWLYHQNGHLLIKENIIIILATILGTTIGSYIGAYKYIPDVYLYRMFVVILYVIGTYIWFKYC
jgi:uncharacterized membrane protein YfcA